MLENELSLINFNKDKVKNILTYLNEFASDEHDKKYLILLLNLDSNIILNQADSLILKLFILQEL